ncbi:MAG: ABC transporter substrate-binding protein [Phormidesmis sp.]
MVYPTRIASIRASLLILTIGVLLAACQQNSTPTPPLDSGIPTKSVDHAMGTTEVPVSPQRVIVLDTTPLDAAIALGIEPVGTIQYGAPPGYLKETVENIEVIGQYNQPNLETILRLEPDLILGAKSISAQLYPQLSQIAPTVFIEGAGQSWDWQNNFRLFAEALGESQQAEQLLAEYQQQLEALTEAIDQPPETISVSVVSSTQQGLVAPTLSSFAGSILKDVGFKRNSAQAIDDQFFVILSDENLAGIEGDMLFLIHNPEWENTPKDEFISDPLWSQLDVVKAGAVCEVAGDVWNSGRSLLSAQQILQDIETCLDATSPEA